MTSLGEESLFPNKWSCCFRCFRPKKWEVSVNCTPPASLSRLRTDRTGSVLRSMGHVKDRSEKMRFSSWNIEKRSWVCWGFCFFLKIENRRAISRISKTNKKKAPESAAHQEIILTEPISKRRHYCIDVSWLYCIILSSLGDLYDSVSWKLWPVQFVLQTKVVRWDCAERFS